MKRVIFGDELDKKKKDAIDLICNAVASTIGPIGNNVLINSDETLPHITNDGATTKVSPLLFIYLPSESVSLNATHSDNSFCGIIEV